MTVSEAPFDYSQRLERELETSARALWKMGRLKPGLHGTDMSEVVKRNLPPRISFHDVERILRDAGFAVRPHPSADRSHDQNRPSDWYAVIAVRSPVLSEIPYKTSLYVTLYPRSPGDYTVVEKVTAQMFVTMP